MMALPVCLPGLRPGGRCACPQCLKDDEKNEAEKDRRLLDWVREQRALENTKEKS